MQQPRRRPPKSIRTQKSAPGLSAKTNQERDNETHSKGNVMTSIATNTPRNALGGYEFATWAELTGGPGMELVSVSTNWDKESIIFPAENLADVIHALQSLKHELTGKRG